MRHLIVGTAGHIDHGKSALVKALTGTDPDRLKEEKLRGITIDLGFAHLDLGDVNIGFVDVPGHERFVKNMLAGVGGIDFVLLVVAADESIMPQTREHFDICRLLGIQAGIVVITKTDLVEPDLIQLVREEIGEMVRGSFLEGRPQVAVSSKTGEGIDQLKTTVHDLAVGMPQRPAGRLLRLPVDRAFSIRGFGTVITGTLTSGELRKDEEVELVPSTVLARVRGIQVYGKPSDLAVAGQRTAVNLQGVDLASVDRGMVLTLPHTFRATRILDVRITLLPDARALKNLVKVRFHQGTSEVLARVALLGQDVLSPGKTAHAQLRLDAPAFCLHGDTFIIRQFSPAVTIGGGIVLNPQPAKHKTTDAEALAALRRAESASLRDRIPILIGSNPSRGMNLRELNSLFGMPEAELKNYCATLTSSGQLVTVPAPVPFLLLPEVAAHLRAETVSRVEEFHRQHPLIKGISREELRNRLYHDFPPDVFRYFLERLVEEKKISLQGEFVCRHGREVQLSSEGQDMRERIEAFYRGAGFQTPGLAELSSAIRAEPEELRRIYFWMLKEKILVKISEDLTYHRNTLEEIKQKIRSALPPGSRFGVAEFKELFGLTRKHAIPLLEYLDRERITRRQGNDRVLL